MLIHPTLEQLRGLRLDGMAKALEEQLQTSEIEEIRFEDRLALLIAREVTERNYRRQQTRLRQAKLRLKNACVEDIDFRTRRGLDKELVLFLGSCEWIVQHRNVLLTGPTGVGKTFLACALAQKACREGYTVQYLRLSRLLEDLALAHADGRYPKLMAGFARTDLLILDDWGLAPLSDADRRELLEILEDRHDLRSTLVTSQLLCAAAHNSCNADCEIMRRRSMGDERKPMVSGRCELVGQQSLRIILEALHTTESSYSHPRGAVAEGQCSVGLDAAIPSQ